MGFARKHIWFETTREVLFTNENAIWHYPIKRLVKLHTDYTLKQNSARQKIKNICGQYETDRKTTFNNIEYLQITIIVSTLRAIEFETRKINGLEIYIWRLCFYNISPSVTTDRWYPILSTIIDSLKTEKTLLFLHHHQNNDFYSSTRHKIG